MKKVSSKKHQAEKLFDEFTQTRNFKRLIDGPLPKTKKELTSIIASAFFHGYGKGELKFKNRGLGQKPLRG